MRDITIRGLSKSYGSDTILSNLDLHIPAGQFFVLLGPSGCGKTTLLRLIAGLESADEGNILLGDTDITQVPVYDRKINTVFQQYALFPHLSVFENVAYGLRVKNMSSSNVRQKVMNALSMVRLTGFESKNIQSLSGGQKQRVSLARAIINEPDVLLLDEPLAALDRNLKEDLLIELIDLQEKLDTTFVYITHDQFEALTVADTMAIMNMNGSVEQIGTAEQIYEFPRSLFVAKFVGKTNVLQGTFQRKTDFYQVNVKGLDVFTVFQPGNGFDAQEGDAVFMSIRPEKIYISKTELEGFSNHLSGTVQDIIYYGQSTQYHVKLSTGQVLISFEQNEEHFPKEVIDYDDLVHLYFQKENVVLLKR